MTNTSNLPAVPICAPHASKPCTNVLTEKTKESHTELGSGLVVPYY